MSVTTHCGVVLDSVNIGQLCEIFSDFYYDDYDFHNNIQKCKVKIKKPQSQLFIVVECCLIT